MTVVDRVARALATHYGVPSGDWVMLKGAARVAIEAMREPDDKMVDALIAWHQFPNKRPFRDAVRQDWPRVIDAALKD